jgi:hypothetical protein
MLMQKNKIKSMRVLSIMFLCFFLTGLQGKSQTVITVQPSTLTRVTCKNGAAVPLEVNATGPQGTTLRYQWFKNTTNSYVNATPIPNANNRTLNFVSAETEIFYLFCQVVPSVTYGSGVWMSENLSVVKYNNGDPIPLVTNAATWASLTTGAYCYPNNDPSQVASKGLLYNWYAVHDPRGIAPLGWKIPSVSEIESASGFSGVDGVGFRDKEGKFFDKYAYWWTADEEWTKTAWLRLWYSYDGTKKTALDDKRIGISVRCKKQ